MLQKQTKTEKKIKINRAKRLVTLKNYLSSADEEDRKRFESDLFKLESMLIHYATVSERLLLFIDNNIIQDILESNDGRKQRFHSFVALLLVAQDYYLIDIFACISPVILFEAGGKRTNYTISGVDELISKITEAMASVGLTTHFVGFKNTKDLLNIFKKIAYDEVQIRKAIDEVVSRKWDRDFSASAYGGLRIPLGLAEEECPEFRLTYFSHSVVKWIFMHMIEKRMYRENKDQPKARKLMPMGNSSVFSIVNKKDIGVEGLGDIELLTYCDLANQTANNSPQITMGLTYDGRLYETLMARSGIVANSPVFKGGEDDPDDASSAFVWSLQQSSRTTKKANRRMQEYSEAFKAFWTDVL